VVHDRPTVRKVFAVPGSLRGWVLDQSILFDRQPGIRLALRWLRCSLPTSFCHCSLFLRGCAWSIAAHSSYLIQTDPAEGSELRPPLPP
jgi:hypothetical protein